MNRTRPKQIVIRVSEEELAQISHQSKHIRTQSSLPRVRKHGKGMRYSLPPI